MQRIQKWRIIWVLFTILTFFWTLGCQKSGTPSQKPDKKTELLKEPYKNEEFATGTYVQVMIYDKNNHEILEAIKNVDTKPFGGYLKSFK